MNMNSARSRNTLWRTLGLAAVFAVAMGILEAICVIYLRHLLSPSENPVAALKRFPVEQIREACTIVMLLTSAWLAGFNTRTRVAYFFMVFGIWDIAYYAGLKWLAQWPSSWLEWDSLFLIPVPWHGPVLAPILVSTYFVVVCIVCIAREHGGAPLRWSLFPVILQIAAMGFWLDSFTNKSSIIKAQGYAGVSYSWSLLACGLVCGCLSVFLAIRSGSGQRCPNNE
jgi:hypothetical protein